MPQMAPMNWLFLYIMFSITFMLFNFMNYYMFIVKSKTSSVNNIVKTFLNWKW